MTLLAPWALWFAMLGAAVVALYLLKIKRHRQVVPALEFWRNLLGPAPVRSLFQRLKRWISLALWLIILTGLVLALGNPIFGFGAMKPRAIAVVLDNSASMQTLEGDAARPRLALAQEKIAELTTRRPVRDEWLLIEAARRPRVLKSWTRNGRAIREAAAAVSPFFGSGDLPAAVALARQLLADKSEPQIVLVTDGAAGASAELAAGDDRMVILPIGEAEDNLGITALSVRVDPQRSGYHVFVSVENSAAEQREAALLFEVEGATVEVQPVTVPAGGVWQNTVVLPAATTGVLRVSLDRPDVLAADQEAVAVLEPIRPARVVLVSPPERAFFFEQALVAMEPLIDLDASLTVSPEELGRLGAKLRDIDLVLLNGVVPATLPACGAFVCVNAWPAELPIREIGELDRPRLAMARSEHPLMRYMSVGGSTLARAKEVDLGEGGTVLATSDDGAPLIFLLRQVDRQFLCLAFDVLETDLPFRNAFPLLLRNAVGHLVAEQRAWTPAQIRIGETITSARPLPSAVTSASVSPWPGEAALGETVEVHNGSFFYDRTEKVGALRVTFGEETAYTAVNLTDPAETRITPARDDGGFQERFPLTRTLWGTMPWVAFAAAATLLIAFEWLSYHQRWTE